MQSLLCKHLDVDVDVVLVLVCVKKRARASVLPPHSINRDRSGAFFLWEQRRPGRPVFIILVDDGIILPLGTSDKAASSSGDGVHVQTALIGASFSVGRA